MELARVRLSDYKALDVTLDMAPLVVLFGPNNVGKTNVLEALAVALGADDFGRFPDAALGWEIPKQVQYLRVAHEVDAKDAAWLVNCLTDGQIEHLPSATAVLAQLRGQLLEEMASGCVSWEDVAPSAERFLREALRSDWFGWASETGLAWLLPPAVERTPELLAAAQELQTASQLWSEPHPFSRTLEQLKAGWSHPILFSWHEEDAPPLEERVHYYGPTSNTAHDLLVEIEAMVLRAWGTAPSGEYVEPALSFQLPGSDVEATITFETLIPGQDPWLEATELGTYRIARPVHEICDELGRIATNLAPRFVTEHHDIVIEPLEPPLWLRHKQRRVRAVLRSTSTGEASDIAIVGAGSRLWTQYAIREALHSFGFEHGLVSEVPRYYLIDEPEQHLHPIAQQQAADWLVELAARGANVVVATHSPAFLNLSAEHVEYIALERDDSGLTRTRSITRDVLGAVDELGDASGLRRSDVLQLVSAALLVEGEHDRRVLDHFFAAELRTLRAWLLPLRGARNTRRLLDSEFLGRAGLPLYVLLDNLRIEAVQTADGSADLTDEEGLVRSLLLQAERDSIVFLPYEEPDILCALPMSAVARRYRDRADLAAQLADDDGYWSRLIGEWREEMASAAKRTSFKTWAVTRFELADRTDLVSELLGVLDDDDAPSPALHRAMQTLRGSASATSTPFGPSGSKRSGS